LLKPINAYTIEGLMKFILKDIQVVIPESIAETKSNQQVANITNMTVPKEKSTPPVVSIDQSNHGSAVSHNEKSDQFSVPQAITHWEASEQTAKRSTYTLMRPIGRGILARKLVQTSQIILNNSSESELETNYNIEDRCNSDIDHRSNQSAHKKKNHKNRHFKRQHNTSVQSQKLDEILPSSNNITMTEDGYDSDNDPIRYPVDNSKYGINLNNQEIDELLKRNGFQRNPFSLRKRFYLRSTNYDLANLIKDLLTIDNEKSSQLPPGCLRQIRDPFAQSTNQA
jgi:hypothetical protein